MTIRGALSDLDNLLKADDIPFYYKPSIKAVMDTIALSSSEKPNNSTNKNDLGVDAVNRKAVHDMLENLPITVEDKWFNWLQKACMRLAELPPVTPQEPILDKIYADIQRLRGCSCSCSDGIIDDVENILDKYKGESEG